MASAPASAVVVQNGNTEVAIGERGVIIDGWIQPNPESSAINDESDDQGSDQPESEEHRAPPKSGVRSASFARLTASRDAK